MDALRSIFYLLGVGSSGANYNYSCLVEDAYLRSMIDRRLWGIMSLKSVADDSDSIASAEFSGSIVR